MVINQLSARTGLYFGIIPVNFGLFFLREKVVETFLDLVGNLLRILYVVSLGRFDVKTFEQYATPFREGVINTSEIPILTKDTGDFYDVFCGEMLLILFGSFHIIVPDELQILNDLVEVLVYGNWPVKTNTKLMQLSNCQPNCLIDSLC